MRKVTGFFAIIALSILLVALGFAAKHGQFESPSQHDHFLSKSIKMENADYHCDLALDFDFPPLLPDLEVTTPHRLTPSPVVFVSPTDNRTLPLLV